MGIKRKHWASRLTILALLVAVCTVPQTRPSEAVNRCQALETIAFSSYSGTVGRAQIALTNYKNCLTQQYGSSKASLVPCARYHQIASAFFVLSSSSRYLTKALVDYTSCVTGEKSIFVSRVLTSCDAYLDVVRIALAAGDVALASFARDASSDCQTRTLLSEPTPIPSTSTTPPGSPTPTPSPSTPVLLEMPPPPIPRVSGESQVGRTMILVWLSPISGYDSVTYKWFQLCTAVSNCRGSTVINGANQISYTIQSKDAGYGISVNILFKKSGFKDYERSIQVSSSIPTPTSTPTPTPTPTPKPTSGVITQPSLIPPPINSGVDCNSNPSPLCGGSGASPSLSPLPVPTLILTPTQAVPLVEVLCSEIYLLDNNPKTPATASISFSVIESLADSKVCPIGMTRKVNKRPTYQEDGIYRSSDSKQINYSPTKDNSSKSGVRLQRFIVCKNLVEAAPKRADIPRTTKVVNGALGVTEIVCPPGHSYVGTVGYYGYKTIDGKPFGGIAGQWPSWTISGYNPRSQRANFGNTCAVGGLVGYWESSSKHVMVCRQDAKSGRFIWTQ